MLFYNKDKFKDLIIYILLALSCLVLYTIRNVLTPFIIGIVLAYTFKNTLNRLEKKYNKRQLISLIIVVVFWTIITVAFIYLIPFLVNQSINLGSDIVLFFNKNNEIISAKINNFLKYFDVKINLKSYLSTSFKGSEVHLFESINNLFSTSLTILNTLYIFIMSPITMYYFLNDWNNIVAFIKKYIPFCDTKKSHILFKSIDMVLSACIKEQFYVCFLLGLFYGILLVFSGLSYGFLIGMLTGFATFIPYVGIIIGLIIGIIMTIYQFGINILQITLTITIFIVGLLLEMNFLLPKLVGTKINLHPLMVIFAMVAGGSLMGFYGLLLALPIAGVIGVLIRFYLKKK